MSHDEGVTTFSGFGSWMSTLEPAQSPGMRRNEVHEMPTDNSYEPYYNNRLDHQYVELPAEVTENKSTPGPAPPPRPPKEYHEDLEVYTPVTPVAEIEKEVFKPVPISQQVRVIVDGVRKVNTATFSTVTVDVPLYCTLDKVKDELFKKGFRSPVGFTTSRPQRSGFHEPIKKRINVDYSYPDWGVHVTDGESCYDPQQGLRINRNESFSQFLTRLQVQVRCINSQLVINNDLRIRFQRTLRVPEDQRTHNLPAEFGRFPLQNVAMYSDKLRKSNNPSLLDMVKKSGVFLTMYQREAMWISFKVDKKKDIHSEYAIRVFAGGINVVSGRKWDNPEPTATRKQDYVVVPPQEHLDGIAIGNDTVRQFIAMPIGSGYSIEKQMTGKEDVGGLQLEIIPSTSKLEMRCNRNRPNLSTNTDATAAFYKYPVGSEIYVEQVGNGTVFMAGVPQEHTYPLLRELLASMQPHGTYHLRAIYKTKLKITIQKSRFSKSTMISKEFSPFATIGEIAETTRIDDKSLSAFELIHDSRPLDTFLNLIESDIIDPAGTITEQNLPGFTAVKQEPKGGGTLSPKKKNNRLSAVLKWSPLGRRERITACGNPNTYDPDFGTMRLSEQYASSNIPPFANNVPQAPMAPYHSGTYSSPNTYSSQYSPSSNTPDYQTYSPSYHPYTSGFGATDALESRSDSHGYSQQSPPSLPARLTQESHGSPQSAAPSYYSQSPSQTNTPSRPMRRKSPPPAKDPSEDAWTMGISAGGKLHQQILPDTDIYRSERWNKSAITMISVQVLNSVAFEAVTGMVAPPTPITLQSYLSAGIPFFSSYQKGKSTQLSGANNFKAIKSVSEMDKSLGVEEGVSVAASQRVACTSCRTNLCDCVLRPCNHAFCSTCVYTRMVNGTSIICRECHSTGKKILGFSAPMALPGEDVVVPKDVPVVVLPGIKGKYSFMAELE